MLGKIVTTEPPYISNDNFEEQLATDGLLVHYFNDFLSLPVFYEAVTYNKESGIFEVVTEAAESLSRQIRSALLEYRSKLLYDQAETSYSPMIKNGYTVLCLDREQGIQWIKRERLPLFLQSDCYFEYRLGKLLSQVDSSCLGQRLQVDSTYRPWAVTSEPSALVPVQDGLESLPSIQGSMTQSKDWLTLANQNKASIRTKSILKPVRSLNVGSRNTLSSKTANITSDLSSLQPVAKDPESPKDSVEFNMKKESQNPCQAMEVYLTETKFSGPQHIMTTPQTITASDFERCARSVVEQVLKNAVSEMKASSCPQEEAGTKSCALTQEIGRDTQAQQAQLGQKAEESEGSELGDEIEEIDEDVGPSAIHDTRKGLQDFKSFLKGTPGENLFHLWMDLERLQSLQDTACKNRHLIRMKSQYMLSCGQCALSSEVLTKLGLASIPCWTEDKLQLAQPRITEVLLLYWWPRFCTAQTEERVAASLRLWRDRQLRPPSGIDPCPRTVTLLPLRPVSCSPQLTLSSSLQMLDSVPASIRHAGSKHASLGPHTHRAASSCLKPLRESLYPVSTGAVPTTHWAPMTGTQSANKKSSLKDSPLSLSLDRTPNKQFMSDGTCSPFLGGRRMERMLQALQSEMRSGFCFTHFCESSGNQLWANGIHFWTDLQDYHQLFYQDGLDPYRVQQQAQLLYSVYLSPGARRTFGVDEESRRQVQVCLNPPFEELFDSVEEHTLSLLFEPWTMMTAKDRVSYEKVDLWEETRRIKTAHYRKLQVLHRKLLLRQKQCVPERSPLPPSPEVPREPDLWAQVPEQFRRYRLGSVLRHRLELQHFHSFLEENFASMDLMCWLDIEQYKRLPQKDRAEREERSKDIRSRYISRKYFFGPNSPASREQQEEVIRLGGGWGRILNGRLLGPVLAEVQNHVRRRIEKKWLPLFLAMPQFAERQKVKSQVEDVVEDQLFLRQRKRRDVWKHVDSTWMASSKEILAFRRALLNPVTCHQFQRFVSLKGDFLENGVLFWLEVQRYKNLFHSHCDEATIQHKVTLIVNSFINSSIPPALQILIPPEQARDILERRRELGPYIFREAQTSVFSQLFKLWPEFLSFRSSVEEELVLPMLEVKKDKQREKLQRRKREEERRAQEEVEKQKSSLAEGLFEDGGSVFGASQEDGETGRENGGPAYATQQVSWSYSKYISALEQEQALLQSRIPRERGVGSLSPSSGTDSSRHSVKSEGSRRSRSQRSILSPRPQNIPH